MHSRGEITATHFPENDVPTIVLRQMAPDEQNQLQNGGLLPGIRPSQAA